MNRVKRYVRLWSSMDMVDGLAGGISAVPAGLGRGKGGNVAWMRGAAASRNLVNFHPQKYLFPKMEHALY